jgi:putative endonuclease
VCGPAPLASFIFINSLSFYVSIEIMFYVYILKSKVDNDLYIGPTNNLKRRFFLHNSKRVPSTAPRTPFSLIYYEAYKSEKDARKRESSLKSRGQARKALIERINQSLEDS